MLEIILQNNLNSLTQYPKILKALGGGEVSKKGMDIGGTWDKDKFNATQTNIDNAGGRKQLQDYFKQEGTPVAMPPMGMLDILKNGNERWTLNGRTDSIRPMVGRASRTRERTGTNAT